jgi:phosphoribosyl-ATP pyrophosphohydrolase
MTMAAEFTLADLAATIARRAHEADHASSYTARLVASGTGGCARKFGEEAIEAVLAAVTEDDAHLTAEAADVLYHLLVVLESRKVPLAAVMAELERRTGESGLSEKTRRTVAKDRP